MENFCKIGKLENKFVEGVSRYDVCRGEKEKGDLRYDLTLIYPERFEKPACAGSELPRTFGHYHAKGQVELFEVISGRALFFMQRYENDPKTIKEAYLAETKEKEKVIILPDFSITTINPEKEKELLVSNWVSVNIKNDYEQFKKSDGNCYRVIEDENGKIIFEKNKNYEDMPELAKLKPKKIPKELENLDFLTHPEKYKKFLTIENCYTKMKENKF
jgi:oxalate decarboxylase/phosphoglucose isomerase-like protein (cupin superfamily)